MPKGAFTMSIRAIVVLLAALVAPAIANAGPVELTSAVFVERRSVDATGKETISLVTADRVVPGDKLRFVIRYRNGGQTPAADFVITNPVPASVAYVAADGLPLPMVSVDGGYTYGDLARLFVKAADGSERPARAADVTHVKWQFAEKLAGGTAGEVAFRAELR
jgi:uncharacterized repeat protein (TIGR01451 family)